MATFKPRALRMRPIAATVSPLPTELTTPPVQKMYLGILLTCPTILHTNWPRDQSIPASQHQIGCRAASKPLAQILKRPLHIQEYQAQFRLIADKRRQHCVFVHRHQQHNAQVALDVNLAQLATLKVMRDSLA